MEIRGEYAGADLDEILHYMTFEPAGQKAVADFMGELGKKIDEIILFLESGLLVQNKYLPEMGIRQKLVNSYIMYYLSVAEEEQVFIIRLGYSGRNRNEVF